MGIKKHSSFCFYWWTDITSTGASLSLSLCAVLAATLSPRMPCMFPVIHHAELVSYGHMFVPYMPGVCHMTGDSGGVSVSVKCAWVWRRSWM